MNTKKNTLRLIIIFNIYSLLLLFSTTIIAQNIGINTENPLGEFHVDSKGNNPKIGNPSNVQQADDFIVTRSGNVGIGTINPENKLHIAKDSNHETLKIEGLSKGNIITDNILLYDINNNNIKKSRTIESYSIATPTIFNLNSDIQNFLQYSPQGSTNVVTMEMKQNTIEGLTYNQGTATITFPKGTYQFIFIYKAVHNIKNCTLSSYYINFPFEDSTTTVHSNAPHINDNDHSNIINYITHIPNNKTWQIHLGRGSSGNCTGSGMNLHKDGTQLIIYRLGD